MKILGEKSLTKKDAIYKLFCIKQCDKNKVRKLTESYTKVYHINCKYKEGRFYLTNNNWWSSRKIVDILSQINQHNGGIKPYVNITCDDEDFDILTIFTSYKESWCKSFRYIRIV